MSEEIQEQIETFFTARDSFKDIVKSIPKRLFILISKILSAKFLVWAAAGYMLYTDKIDQYGFIIVSCLFLFGRQALQFVKDIKK